MNQRVYSYKSYEWRLHASFTFQFNSLRARPDARYEGEIIEYIPYLSNVHLNMFVGAIVLNSD